MSKRLHGLGPLNWPHVCRRIPEFTSSLSACDRCDHSSKRETRPGKRVLSSLSAPGRGVPNARLADCKGVTGASEGYPSISQLDAAPREPEIKRPVRVTNGSIVVYPLARCPPICYACAISPFLIFAARCSPFPVPRTPENNFDVHVLRTFTRELNAWIVPLQTTAPHASETINQVIYALNLTFRDVEQSYLVWRNERVQGTLRSGMFFLLFSGLSKRIRPCPTCRIPIRQGPYSSSHLAPRSRQASCHIPRCLPFIPVRGSPQPLSRAASQVTPVAWFSRWIRIVLSAGQ